MLTVVRGRASTVAVFVAVAVAAGAAWWVSRPELGPPAPIEDRLPMASARPAEPPIPMGASVGPTAAVTPEVVAVAVHVTGAVVLPGVYRLTPGARVADVIQAAGGVTPDADLERLNLAAVVADGTQIWVPVAGRDAPVVVGPAGGTGAGATSGATPGPIPINTADVATLEELPGIGPSLAEAIVRYRDENGPFVSVDQLLDVPGIGPAKLEQLADAIVI